MKQLAMKFVVTYYIGIFNTYFLEFYQVQFLKIKFNLLAKQAYSNTKQSFAFVIFFTQMCEKYYKK